jgi:hypothetical protein
VIITGRVLGIQAVRLTPIDVAVSASQAQQLKGLVDSVGSVPVRVGLFSGQLVLAVV